MIVLTPSLTLSQFEILKFERICNFNDFVLILLTDNQYYLIFVCINLLTYILFINDFQYIFNINKLCGLYRA